MEYFKAQANKNGNIKVGQMWTFNKTAGSGVLLGCKGSCGKYCDGACYNPENPKHSSCYVFKSYVQYGIDNPNNQVIKSHNRNTMAIRTDINRAFIDIREQISKARKKPAVYRIHAAGELESADELILWIQTAQMFPETQFYIYTKAYDIVDEALSMIGCESKTNKFIPDNWHMNISVWHNCGIETYNKWKHLPSIRAFVYDDGDYDYSKDIKIDCYCPAYKANEKGKVKLNHETTCDKCGICFQNKARVCACLSH